MCAVVYFIGRIACSPSYEEKKAIIDNRRERLKNMATKWARDANLKTYRAPECAPDVTDVFKIFNVKDWAKRKASGTCIILTVKDRSIFKITIKCDEETPEKCKVHDIVFERKYFDLSDVQQQSG